MSALCVDALFFLYLYCVFMRVSYASDAFFVYISQKKCPDFYCLRTYIYEDAACACIVLSDFFKALRLLSCVCAESVLLDGHSAVTRKKNALEGVLSSCRTVSRAYIAVGRLISRYPSSICRSRLLSSCTLLLFLRHCRTPSLPSPQLCLRSRRWFRRESHKI